MAGQVHCSLVICWSDVSETWGSFCSPEQGRKSRGLMQPPPSCQPVTVEETGHPSPNSRDQAAFSFFFCRKFSSQSHRDGIIPGEKEKTSNIPGKKRETKGVWGRGPHVTALNRKGKSSGWPVDLDHRKGLARGTRSGTRASVKIPRPRPRAWIRPHPHHPQGLPGAPAPDGRPPGKRAS